MTRKKKEPRYLQVVKPRPFGQEHAAPAAPEPPGAPDLIVTSDFQSTRLTITLLASQQDPASVRPADGPQIFGSSPKPRKGSKAQVVSQIALTELLDGGAVIDVPPPDFYEEGQVVFVLMKALRPGDPAERVFSANARLEQVSQGEDGSLTVRLQFIKADTEAWRSFRALFADRQREIEEFFFAARGR